MHYFDFWFLCSKQCFWGSSMLLPASVVCFLLLLNSTLLFIDICVMNFNYYECNSDYSLYMLMYGYIFISFRYIGVILLHHKMSVYLTLYETANLFPKMGVPFCTPTNSVWEFLLLLILANTCYCQSFYF
jgi:hypothetical protein